MPTSVRDRRATYVASARHYDQTYSTADVVQIAGITDRQAQWLDEKNVVCPKHRAHRRIYSFDQVVETCIISELRKKRISLQNVRRILRGIRSDLAKKIHRIVADPQEGWYLITCAGSAMIASDQEDLFDLLANLRQPVSLVSISSQVEKCLTYRRKDIR
jgi:DNA-binding transcriptional MerR regulator